MVNPPNNRGINETSSSSSSSSSITNNSNNELLSSSCSRGQQRPRSASSSTQQSEQRPAQRLRESEDESDLIPVDKTSQGTRIMNTTAIKINTLMQEDVESRVDLDEKHIDVQILRIITPQDGKTGNAMTRYQRGNQQKTLTFTRILLCRSGTLLVYLMMSNDMNRRLFHRDLLLRDNGTITVGSYLRILAPHPIERNMNGIPLLKSDYPAIAMDTPKRLAPIYINSHIEGNKSGCAVLNGAFLKLSRSTPFETTCRGKHCDKQRPHDWTNKNKKCGCYGGSSVGTSNVCITNNGKIKYRGLEIPIKLFASTNFQHLFMTGPFPPNTELSALEHTEASYKLKQCMKECIELINDHDGFEVVMWYSRGEINDLSLVGINMGQENEKTDSGKMNYHVISIRPNDKDFLKPDTLLGDVLEVTKFNVEENL